MRTVKTALRAMAHTIPLTVHRWILEFMVERCWLQVAEVSPIAFTTNHKPTAVCWRQSGWGCAAKHAAKGTSIIIRMAPQHVLQNPAIAEVLDLIKRIEMAVERNSVHPIIGAVDSTGKPPSWHKLAGNAHDVETL